MQAAPYDGLEVYNDSGIKVVKGSQRHKAYPTVGSSEAVSPKSRICGLSRTAFWLAVAMGLLALTMIGLGAGLGVALSKANANNGGEFQLHAVE